MAGTGGERNAAGRAYAPPATACPPAPPPELSTWKVLLLAVAAVVAAFSGLPGTDDDDGMPAGRQIPDGEQTETARSRRQDDRITSE